MGDNKFQPVKTEEELTRKVWWSAFTTQAPGIMVFTVIAVALFALSLDEGNLLGRLGMLLIGPVIYLIPGAVAWHRKHNNRNAIIMLNILLGWTFLGWVGALVWAMTNPGKK